MKSLLVIPLALLGTAPLLAEENRDLVRFLNGDIMHGKFCGMKEGVFWEGPTISGQVRFESKTVSQIIFGGGHPQKPFPLSPSAHLINGDEIPGHIIGLDDSHLIFNSPLTGELRIPRAQLSRLQPNPHGGTLHYAGPFTDEGWTMLTHLPSKKENEEKVKDPKKEKKPPWVYSGAAFYSKSSTPLLRQADLPPKGRLRFKMAWKNRLNFSLAFHCDLQRPIVPEKKDDNDEDEKGQADNEGPAPLKFKKLSDLIKGNTFQEIPWLEPHNSNHATTFGTGYVLALYSSYPNLHRCTFTESGQPHVANLRSSRSRSNLGESGSAEFDLRFDRENNSIVLFIDGEYVTQWNDLNGYVGQGNAIAFAANSQCQLRLSDIRVSSWNGMRDSALSMEHHERDIVLLTNGTDRFSGKITNINENELTLKGPYAEIKLPLHDIADIHFSRAPLADAEKIDWSPKNSLIYFHPVGRLSVIPRHATRDILTATSPLLDAPLNIQLEAATLLELHKTAYDLDEWFDEF